MAEDVEQNKKNVVDFYDLMFNQCQPRQAMERYAGERYIQHNPMVADGKEAFIGDWAGIDIFRLDDNGKIVEHWDVLQRVPSGSKNTNSMF